MLKTLAITFALAFAASSVTAAPMLDAKGKCRDNGKFVSASMCKTAAPAASTSGSYTLDAKGNCHGPGGKMVKKTMCAASATTTASAPAAVTTTTRTETTRTASATVKHCTKGKPCGKTCISMKDTCHIPQ